MNPTSLLQTSAYSISPSFSSNKIQSPLLSTSFENISPTPVLASSFLRDVVFPLHEPILKTGGLLLGALAVNKSSSWIREKIKGSTSLQETTKFKINTGLTAVEFAFYAGASLY